MRDWNTGLPTLVHYCFWICPPVLFLALVTWVGLTPSLEQRRQKAIEAYVPTSEERRQKAIQAYVPTSEERRQKAIEAKKLAWVKQCGTDGFYIRRDKKIKGPFTAAQIVDFVQDELLKRTDEVGQSATGTFTPLKNVYSHIKRSLYD